MKTWNAVPNIIREFKKIAPSGANEPIDCTKQKLDLKGIFWKKFQAI